MRFHFDDCVLDTGTRELRRGDQRISLQPKGFRLLEVLIERRPAVVSQEELRDLLWPDVEAGGTTLARLVSEVRTAVGDSGDTGKIIRTVPRFGYAFCARADESIASQTPKLHACALQWKREVFPLVEGENLIGRSEDAHITIATPEVSRRHAHIVVTNGAAVLNDLGSRNGTFLGTDRVTAPTRLKHRDRISIGPALLVFYVAAEEETVGTVDG